MSSNLKLIHTPLQGLYIVERNVIRDNRGFFYRLYSKKDLESIGIKKSITHVNFSHTNEMYTVRGLHYQNSPYTETKIVTCVKGEIFDVAVDLRKSSPTFLKWFGLSLSAKNQLSLLIPDGFAHGFQVIENDSEMIYLHTEEYVKESEGGLNVLDPMIGISWPSDPINLSDRDKNFPFIDKNFEGITL